MAGVRERMKAWDLSYSIFRPILPTSIRSNRSGRKPSNGFAAPKPISLGVLEAAVAQALSATTPQNASAWFYALWKLLKNGVGSVEYRANIVPGVETG